MRRGFTLIETMIAMSLMAILLAGHIEFFRELNAVQRQQDFLRAARQAERQLLELDKVPFELLPPQLLKPDSEGWLQLSLLLYVVTGLFWLPVVWIQIRLRDIARQAAADEQPLPAQFDRLFRIWFAAGIPAFAAVLAILWLMLNRPAIGLP